MHENRVLQFNMLNRQILNTTEKSSQYLSANFSDIAVSNSTSPATFSQDNATVVSLSDNSWLVAFEDDRNGSRKIYWQRYDSLGQTIGSNELVASSQIGSDFVEPILKSDTLGRVYLFFRNSSEGLVYATRYNADLTVDIPSFLVNDTTGASFAGPIDASVYPNGKFIVTWENYSIVGSTISARIYNSSGVSIFGPTTVNADGGAKSHWVPSVDVDPLGNFLIAWEDYRNNRADIYAQLYNGSGSKIGVEFSLIPPPSNTFNQFEPEVCFISNNQFVIGWVDQRDGQEMYYQIYSSQIGLVGTNQLIAPANNLYINWNLSFTRDSQSKLSAIWASFGPQNYINMQPFTLAIAPDGSPLTKNSSLTGRRWKPSMAINLQNEYMVSWTEFATNNSDIHCNLFDSSHNSLMSSEFKANDDLVGAISINPSICVSTDWYNIIAFEDRRDDAGDIYVQTISNTGVRLYANIKVNQDNGDVLQTGPSISASIPTNKTLVSWIDNRDLLATPGQRIYARFGNEFGLFSASEFLVSDSGETAPKREVQTAINDSGKSLVVWLDKRSGIEQVYGQWLATDGSLEGSNFLISDPNSDSTIIDLQVKVDNASNFYITYLEKRHSPHTFKSKQYLSNGTVGQTFEKQFPIISQSIEQVSTGVKTNGNIIVAYNTFETYERLYLAEYNNNGTEVVAPFEILDVTNIDAVNVNLSVSNNDYVNTSWVDTRNGFREIYTQLFDNSLTPINGNMQVSSASPEFMQSPQVTAHNGRAWYCWVDPRANGLNVYANNMLYLSTDIDDNNTQLPQGFKLMQNYPNPFNPTTEIAFNIPQNSFVTVSVYNMLGQHVKTLVEKEFSAGVHLVSWDATNAYDKKVASGIYFYKMETAEFTDMKKMILIK